MRKNKIYETQRDREREKKKNDSSDLKYKDRKKEKVGKEKKSARKIKGREQ